jgi:hypothetical protein
VPDSGTLVFSYTGFTAQEIQVSEERYGGCYGILKAKIKPSAKFTDYRYCEFPQSIL